jgi:MFS family permease
MASSERRSLLRDHDFQLFLSGRLVSEIGSRITRDGLPVTAILALSATAPQLAFLSAAQSLPGLFLSPLLGVAADRLRRRPLLIAGDLARALLLFTIPAAALMGQLSLVQLLVVTFAVSGLTVFYEIADQAYFPGLVGRNRLEEGNALVYGAGAIGETAGPTLMGTLVQWLGAPIAILVDAVSYLVSAWSLLAIRKPEAAPKVEDRGALKDSLQGLRVVMRHPLLRPLLVINSVDRFFGGFYATLYELYVLRTLHLSPLALGVLVTFGGIGSLIASPIAASLARRSGVGKTVAWSFVVWAALSMFVPLAQGPWLFAFGALFLAQLLCDFTGTIYEVNETVLRQSVAPDEWLGRVNGTIQFGSGALSLIGTLVSGLIAVRLGNRDAFWIASIGVLLAGLWLVASPIGRQRGTLSVDPDLFSQS